MGKRSRVEKVAGSIPAGDTNLYVYVAQSAERLAVNQIVAGSIPAVNANMLR